MGRQKPSVKLTKVIDETIKLSKKFGNGIVRILVSVDTKGKLGKYSFAYINFQLCHADNGRVLGYDNNHGYHHRHYMGREEPFEFVSYEDTAVRFEKEWRELHEKTKKHSY